MRDGRNGGKLRSGGTNPGAGRPPDEFKAMCRALASSQSVESAVKLILLNGSADPMFLGALKWASEHGYGRPEQALDLTSDGKPLAVVVQIVREGRKVTSG